MTTIGLGVLLDRACSEIVARGSARTRGSRLVVHPAVYRSVAEAHPRDVARGLPLFLLGLELIASDDVAPSDFKIVG